MLKVPSIEVRNITKSFRNVKALLPTDLEIQKGSSFALIGSNGAGKTTLMNIILGLVIPDSGSITIGGISFTDPSSRRNVRYLPERVSFPKWATPRILFRQIERIRKEASRKEFEKSCTELECIDLLNRPLGKMSKGQRQRVAVAMVTCGNPEVLLLDEPSTGLDPGGRVLVRNLIRRMTDQGATVMLNSHLLGEVERVCSIAAFISMGKLVAQGSLDEMARFKGQALVKTVFSSDMLENLSAFGYSCHTADEGVRIALPDANDFRLLAARVIESAVDFTCIELQKEDLEDVFLRVMGGDEDVPQQP